MRLPYFIVFQIISLVMALVYYRHIRLFSLQVMLPLMAFVCTIEIVAANIGVNLSVYNIYVFISPVFYYILFFNIIRFKPVFKKVYIAIAILCITLFAYDYFFLRPGDFNAYSMMGAMITYIILSCIVLAQIITDDTRHISLLKEPYFWLTTGIIIFSLVSVVVLGLYTFIARNAIQIFGKNMHRIIMPLANVVLYSCWSYSFYLCKVHSNKIASLNFPKTADSVR